jgi:hypothetical protein
MRTIRRLYFYAVSLVSLEVVLWGLIGLVRSTITPEVVGGAPTRLAQSLALILVGVPVFWIHWFVAQRNAHGDMDEHASGVRAFFLYATLIGVLVPIVQNLITLVNHIVLRLFNISPYLTMFSREKSWPDNLVALLMNGLVAIYFLSVLKQDWKTVTPADALRNLRRLYRTLWVIYALVLVVAGVQQILRFVLYIPIDTLFGPSMKVLFINGLTLLLVGTPLFYYTWNIAQNALTDTRERESLLRLGLLYVLALSGVITVLSTSGIVVDVLLRLILGEKMNLSAFMGLISNPISLGTPLAGVWAYFGHWLNRSMTEVPDAPRRAGLRRFYFYILSAIGVVATFIGLSFLLLFVIDNLMANAAWATSLRPRLASALAVLMVSFPLWWLTWLPMQTEALQAGDSGDHARRSVMRKAYLYLALFASVIGGMVATGSSLFLLLRNLLGDQPVNMLRDLLNNLQFLLLFVLLGLYHGFTLRGDGQRAAEALNQKHAAFPVLLFDPGDAVFVEEMQVTLAKLVPNMPLQVQSSWQPLSVENQAAIKAVLLPGELALQPPAPLAEWLDGFQGNKLVIPTPVSNWIWSGLSGRSRQELYRQTAQILRQMAEGQEVRNQSPASGWMVAFYILLGLIMAPITITLVASLIFR